MLGGLLALLSAATFGLNDVSIRRGVLTGTPFQGTAITVPLGVPLFALGALIAGSFGFLGEMSPAAFVFLAIAGFIHLIWGRYWQFQAIRAMGTNLVGPVQQTTLIISLGGSVWFLDEVLTPLRLLGIGLILLGSLAILKSRPAPAGRETPTSAPLFQPKYLLGFTSAALAALGFGSSVLFIRAALEGAGPSAGLPGGLVSYAAATSVLAASMLWRRQRQHVFSVDRRSARWFTLSGILAGVSHMFRFMALGVAPVTVVAPLLQTQFIFRLLFGWFLNRDYEDFSFWTLTGILISLIGALALSVSVDFVAALLPLPETLADIIRWQWP